MKDGQDSRPVVEKESVRSILEKTANYLKQCSTEFKI